MPRRKLIKGDRVKITGPWRLNTDGNGEGRQYIGEYATVIRITNHPTMSVDIHMDSDEDPSGVYHWCRENLRALPKGRK